MTAAEIWCNESQERYVLALAEDKEPILARLCHRERCPYAVIGTVTEARTLIVTDPQTKETPVNLPLADILDLPGPPPLTAATIAPPPATAPPSLFTAESLAAAATALLRHPTVASKRFLITLGDRTVGGLTARDQMIGPRQVPVADCALIANDFDSPAGVAFALGERPPIALHSPSASVRLAVSEALLNLAAADNSGHKTKLSVNWMANANDDIRLGELRHAVTAITDFCTATGHAIIVGKDSLSMRVAHQNQTIESPVTAVVTAVTPVSDIRRHWTPLLSGQPQTLLMRLTPSTQQRLAGSVADQCGFFTPSPTQHPDITPDSLNAILTLLSTARANGWIHAYHDISDGGLWATLCEIAFASHCGLDIFIDPLLPAAGETDNDPGDDWPGKTAAILFNEEPGVVIETTESVAAEIMSACPPSLSLQTVARIREEPILQVYAGGKTQLKEPLTTLRQAWETVSHDIISERDNPKTAAAEWQSLAAPPPLFARLPSLPPLPPPTTHRPSVGILREQGSNGQREMAAAFTRAGFTAIDLTTSDLLDGRHKLDDLSGIALCGGFSFGDVLGAGRGWALSILHHPRLSESFRAFFARPQTFTLGVCNGCQALSHLQSLMPAADRWQFPTFHANESRRFEARLSMVEVMPSPSPLLTGLTGLMFPIVASHGEGRAILDPSRPPAPACLRYIDGDGHPTETYPNNPNGSAGGLTGFTSPDGRILLMMPHPERRLPQPSALLAPSRLERHRNPMAKTLHQRPPLHRLNRYSKPESHFNKSS